MDAALAAILRGLLPRELPFAELDTVLNARQRGGAKAVAQMSAAFAAEEGQLPSDNEEEEDKDTEVVIARVKEAMADLARVFLKTRRRLLRPGLWAGPRIWPIDPSRSIGGSAATSRGGVMFH